MQPVVARRAAMNAELLSAWAELAGPDYASHTRPERIQWPRRAGDDEPFEPGVLVVACEGGAAIRLQHEAGAIVERVNRFLGFNAVARLRVVQKPRPARKAARAALPRLDADEQRRLEEMLAPVADAELKRKLARLGRGVLARAKAAGRGSQ